VVYNGGMDMNDLPELMSASELARIAGVHVSDTARFIRDGRLRAEKVGAMWLIRREDAAAWLLEREKRIEAKADRAAAKAQAKADRVAKLREQLALLEADL